jgi:tetratricopeptide (TPR) repeat protein
MNGVDSAVVCELNLRLAETYVVLGALREARAAIERAVALAAKMAPDPARDARLAVMRAYAALANADTQPVDAVLDATRILEQLGDYAGAARGWEAVCESYAPRAFRGRRSQRLQQEEAAQRMLACAERAGSAALAGRAMLFFSASLTYGKTPIPEAIARIHALIARAPDVTIRARLMWGVTELQAMSGQFEDARRTLAGSFALLPHGERTRYRGSRLAWAGRVEMWAGNTLRVEELVREEGDLHRQEGFLAYLASEQTLLVDALVAQHRLQEASTLLEDLVPYTAPDDIDARLRQARSRARLELARGDLAAAEAAARASLEHLADAEAPDDEAETLLVLAQILRAAGRAEEALDAAHEALRLSQERKHVVLEQRARAFLSAPTGDPVPA